MGAHQVGPRSGSELLADGLIKEAKVDARTVSFTPPVFLQNGKTAVGFASSPPGEGRRSHLEQSHPCGIPSCL